MNDQTKKILALVVVLVLILIGILWMRSGDSDPGQLIPPAVQEGDPIQGEEVVAPEPEPSN